MTEEEKANLPETIANIFEKVDKYVGIIAAIIAALTFAQGNRIVSYAFVIIGYALMASFLWRVIAQKSVVRRAIATVRPLPEKREYRYPRSQRRMAGVALIVLTLFSFGWVGVNGWRDYQAREGLLFPKAKENELLVIIAQFDNRSTKGIDPTQRIYDRLRKELAEAGITNTRLEIAPEVTNLDGAREIRKRYGAIFVIWGWFDDVGFKSYFTPVKEKPFILKEIELKEVPLEPPGEFSLYIREGLPAQMAYFSTWTIGQVYYWDAKFGEALRAFDRAIENAQEGGTSEGLPDVYFYRGYIHGTVFDDLQRAITNYDRVIELRPDDAGAYNNRGAAYTDKGEYDLAMADFNRAIELKPDFGLAYYNRGLVYADKGEYDLAITNYDKAIELRPDDADAYINRGAVYTHKGKYDLAIADFNRAIELRPDFAEAYNSRGAAYDDKGEYDLAIADYNRAIELKPDLAEAFNNRGNSYRHKGEYDLAIADYDRAIELKPDLAEAFNNRGIAYADKGEYDLAIADYDKAIGLRPDLAETYNNRGSVYADKGNYDQAIANYDKAIELKPDYADAYNNRGIAYHHKGEYDLAIANYDKAIELKPDYADAYNNRGGTYYLKGEYDLAIADYDRAIELSPDLDKAYNNRGVAYAHKGEYDLAIADYNKAIELRPDLAEAYYNRGVARKTKGEKEEAIRDLERFLDLSEDEDLRKKTEEHLRELRGQ